MMRFAASLGSWLSREPKALSPVLIGHSHSRAIFAAAARVGMQLRGYDFWTAPQPAIAPGGGAFHPEISEALSNGLVFSAVGGAAHNILAMVAHPRPFDFVLPERPDLPIAPGAELLPYEAMREAMSKPLQEYLDIIDLVRRTARGRVFHIEAPPPLEDGDRVLADVPWLFFQNLTRQVAPAAVRWKCWRLHSQLVAAFCAERGIEVISAPAASLDDRGYLSPEFYLDAMHVGESYGALVLQQMKARL